MSSFHCSQCWHCSPAQGALRAAVRGNASVQASGEAAEGRAVTPATAVGAARGAKIARLRASSLEAANIVRQSNAIPTSSIMQVVRTTTTILAGGMCPSYRRNRQQTRAGGQNMRNWSSIALKAASILAFLSPWPAVGQNNASDSFFDRNPLLKLPAVEFRRSAAVKGRFADTIEYRSGESRSIPKN